MAPGLLIKEWPSGQRQLVRFADAGDQVVGSLSDSTHKYDAGG